MTRIVDMNEAKSHFSLLLEQAHAGEEIVISKAGKPYARLVPLAPETTGRRPGRLAGKTLDDAFFDPLPEDELPDHER
ncbi:MAG TPA: type II toxin-antitoxin system prevent-host-death family antitoxin [Quisquiliibacterium sp.]|nr:type II toxin-antitoxin system prevent-host-death family antitoxin [Quisquiliibacterium sp.]